MNKKKAALVFALALALVGCGGSSDPSQTGGGKQTLSGALIVYEGQSVPTMARPVLIWSVTAGTRESYVYKFGEGTLAGETFSVRLDADPPVAAINPRGVGLAYLLLLPSSVVMADGKFRDLGDIADQRQGASQDTIVIYRQPGSDLEGTGLDDAPDGYSCARQDLTAVRPSFATIPCSALEIHIGGTMPAF